MDAGVGKAIIAPCGYASLIAGFIGLLWGFLYIWFGNIFRLVFKGWLKIIYVILFILFYLGTILVFVGGAYYFTIWYVLNPESNNNWKPKK